MQLIIEGKSAVLKEETSISLKIENPAFSDKGDYSLEIALPLAGCPQNIAILNGAYHRSEQSFSDIIGKRMAARLIAGTLSLYGAVSLISVDEKEAQVQFLSGRPLLELECKDADGNDMMVFNLDLGKAFDTAFKNLCPDLEYNDANIYRFIFGLSQKKYPLPQSYAGGKASDWENINTMPYSLFGKIDGDGGGFGNGFNECAILPVHVNNATGPTKIFNRRCVYVFASATGSIHETWFMPETSDLAMDGNIVCPRKAGWQEFLYTMANNISDTNNDFCPQPKLFLIAERIMQAIGHPVKQYDNVLRKTFPDVIIVNPVSSLNYADMMPDWTVLETIQEIEKLCGVRFSVGENGEGHIELTKQYYDKRANHITLKKIVAEHSVEIDEEKEQSDITRANVAYAFDEGQYTAVPNGIFIRKNVIKDAPLKFPETADGIEEDTKKRNTIYYPKQGEAKCLAYHNTAGVQPVAPLGPLMRDNLNIEAITELRIIPAASVQIAMNVHTFVDRNNDGQFYYCDWNKIATGNYPVLVSTGSWLPPGGSQFDTASVLKTSESSVPDGFTGRKSKNKYLEIAIVSDDRIYSSSIPDYWYYPFKFDFPYFAFSSEPTYLRNVVTTAGTLASLQYSNGVVSLNNKYIKPCSVTDTRIQKQIDELRERLAHMLDLNTASSLVYSNSLDPERSDTAANTKAEYCFQFTDPIKPDDIQAVFHIRNRKFIMSKLEISITQRGVSPMKTGYFYETDR